MMLVLPDPVCPTSATVWPGLTSNETSSSTGVSEWYLNVT